MKKILKTKGNVDQWTKVIKLSMDQMGLKTQTKDNVVSAFYDNQPLMKFQISENEGTFIAIEYLDERDLEDFKLTAANIFSNFGQYANTMPTEDQNGSDIQSTPESTPVSSTKDGKTLDALSQLADQPAEAASKADDFTIKKPKKKGKGLIIALIIIGALLILGAAAYFGYSYYQNLRVTADIYEQAEGYYEMGSYEEAINLAQSLISDYPKAKEVEDAKTLINVATKAMEEQKKKADETAQKAVQNIIRVSRISVSEPDEDGYFEVAIDYTNQSEKEIEAITFGVIFTDANGKDITLEDADETIILCNDEGPFAKGEGRFDGEANWGYYDYDGNVKDGRLVSVYIAYTDGSEYAITEEGEASWVVF